MQSISRSDQRAQLVRVAVTRQTFFDLVCRGWAAVPPMGIVLAGDLYTPNSGMHDRSCDADYRCIGGNRHRTGAGFRIKGPSTSPGWPTRGSPYDVGERNR